MSERKATLLKELEADLKEQIQKERREVMQTARWAQERINELEAELVSARFDVGDEVAAKDAEILRLRAAIEAHEKALGGVGNILEQRLWAALKGGG